MLDLVCLVDDEEDHFKGVKARWCRHATARFVDAICFLLLDCLRILSKLFEFHSCVALICTIEFCKKDRARLKQVVVVLGLVAILWNEVKHDTILAVRLLSVVEVQALNLQEHHLLLGESA